MSSNAVEKIKALYAAQTVTSKTFSIGDGFKTKTKAAKEYQTEDGNLRMPVVGISAKFVEKYNAYQTLFYLQNGDITGSFSEAIFNFANTMFTACGIDISDYGRVDFDKPMTIEVAQKTFPREVEKDGQKTTETWSTYECSVIDGDAQKFRATKSVHDYINFLGAEDGFAELPEQAADVPSPEPPAEAPTPEK